MYSTKQTTKQFLLCTTPLSILIFIAFLPLRLPGQCGAEDLIPSVQCEDAPIICLQNWCFNSTLESSTGIWPGFCGPNTAVHNPHFYQVVATDTVIEIHLQVGECSGGQNALQPALIGTCPWEIENVIDCNPSVPENSFAVLYATDLIVGQSYWVLIDGSAGSTCAYSFVYASGIYVPLITQELDSFTANPSTIVQGAESVMLDVSPDIQEAHGYYWVLGWSGDTITSTQSNTTIDIPCDLAPGIYQICARAYSGCDTTETEICTQIEVLPKGPEAEIIQMEDTLCTNLSGMPAYHWFDCNSGEVFSTEPCYTPSSTGCYCAAVAFANGCIDTTCYDFIFSSIPNLAEDQISITPIPSDGTLNVSLSEQIALPVKWTLIDTYGRSLENGVLDQHDGTITLEDKPPSGLYYLKILSSAGRKITAKLMIENY